MIKAKITHKKGDVWSLGLIIFEIIENQFPFDLSLSQYQLMMEIINNDTPKIKAACHKAFKDLIY